MTPHFITLIIKKPQPQKPNSRPLPQNPNSQTTTYDQKKKRTKRINPEKIIIFITLNSLQYNTKE